MIIDITPCPKPRMTRSDKWKKRPIVMKYRAFADELRLKVGDYKPGGVVFITCIIPMPKSWSKKKKEIMDGIPHQQKPDIDNYLKAFLDALCDDDSHVWDLRGLKFWGKTGKIVINGY